MYVCKHACYIHALVLPQPVYQEFASLRPPLGGRTRLVYYIISAVVCCGVRSITDQLQEYIEEDDMVYSDVTQLASIVQHAGHRYSNK